MGNQTQQDRYRNLLYHLRAEDLANDRERDFNKSNGDMYFLTEDDPSKIFLRRMALCLENPKVSYTKEKMEMRNYTALLQKRLEYFVWIVEDALTRGTEVLCFVTTVHPNLENFLIKATTYAERKAELLLFMERQFGDRVDRVNCSTPEKFGGLRGDFWDAGHIGAHNADTLLRFLLVGRTRSNY